MSLVIAHNMMAQNAAMNLGRTYGKLSTSVQRLSSGYRINSAADDAAGLAIRELMRTDIRVTQQGIRNAADGVSMIQTADGSLGVIDEKLTRMKELAEQAATGTYTTVQRDIINSEYQAMAREVDRIASATNFNGIKLLDGSVSNQHGGRGLKLHFGVGNNASEDYYFINMGDARATTSTGLQIGGDAKNDIWGQNNGNLTKTARGCCAGSFQTLDQPDPALSKTGYFSYGYNWDRKGTDGKLDDGKHTAGIWELKSGSSLQNIIDQVNKGTQSRVMVTISGTVAVNSASAALGICFGDSEVYYVGKKAIVQSASSDKTLIKSFSGTISALVKAINESSKNFIAMYSGNNAYVFAKEGGDKNNLKACETNYSGVASATLNQISFTNVANNKKDSGGTFFSLGGENWGTLRGIEGDNDNYSLMILGRDAGKNFDINLTDIKAAKLNDWNLLGLTSAKTNTVSKMTAETFAEIQQAADGNWDGAEVRTQSSAQKALDAITKAIVKKDKIRADLGAVQNRLENTMTNLTIQAYNLQASESRISDVDMATEMTNFTKNNILAQAATSMLAQANSLSQLALTLIS